MVAVLEEFLLIENIRLLPITFPCLLDTLDRLSGRVPGRGIKAIRHLRAVVPHDPVDLFYHSSFPEFLKSESPLLPDVPLKLQRAVSRCLAGCFKSLSKAAMDGQASEEHVDFCLAYFTLFLRKWTLGEDDDPSSLLKAMLTVDFTTCFLQTLPPCGSGRGSGLYFCLVELYDPELNVFTLCMGSRICANLLEDALSHLQSSVEGVFLRILDPDYFTSHFDSFMTPDLGGSFVSFMAQMSKHRPLAFDDVVRALRHLLEEQEELFRKLERRVLDVCLKQERPAIESMFKLADPVDEA
jgi:hypothetical protein